MMRILLSLSAALLLAACNDISMTQQNRYGTYTPAALFPDGTEAQALPAGVVAQGDLDRADQAANPPAVDAQLAGARASSATISIVRPATACPATATA